MRNVFVALTALSNAVPACHCRREGAPDCPRSESKGKQQIKKYPALSGLMIDFLFPSVGFAHR